MGNSFTINSFLALLGCFFTGLAFAWLLYRKKSAAPDVVRIGLAITRTVSVTLILWLLFSPLVKQLSYSLEKPVVIMAQDNSQSAGTLLPPGFDSRQYQADLVELSKALAEKYEVRSYNFGDAVSQGLDFGYTGKFTNASVFANQLNDEFLNRNIGAVILSTDGIFNRGGNPSPAFEMLKTPVYPIALGDTIPKTDVLITQVRTNDLVFLDNDFKIDIQVEAYQCDGQQTRLTVLEDGKKVHEGFIQLKGNQVSKNIAVVLKAAKLGHHQYTISLSGLKNEISLKNNRWQTAIEVIDDRLKVLIAAASPHPDIAAIKQAVASNKRYELSVCSPKELSSVEPGKYGLIILYQLPAVQFDDKEFLRKVVETKIPLWYIIGAQSDFSKLNRAQGQLNYTLRDASLQYIYSEPNAGFSAFDLDSSAKKTISSFDPLQAPSGILNLLGQHQVIFNQRIGKAKTTQPQLFFMEDNGRKTGFLIGEGIWKWRLAEHAEKGASPVFDDLVAKIFQYLSIKDDKRKFRVFPTKNAFDENEPILLNAILYNDSYQPVNSPDVSIVIKDSKGKTYNFSFSKAESSYHLEVGILPYGSYTYEAKTMMGNQKYTASGTFIVNEQLTEFQQTIANHQLLFQLAERTNGKMYAPDKISELKKELLKEGKMKTLSYEDRKYEELINLKWLFAVILLLLSTEWFFRKINSLS